MEDEKKSSWKKQKTHIKTDLNSVLFLGEKNRQQTHKKAKKIKLCKKFLASKTYKAC